MVQARGSFAKPKWVWEHAEEGAEVEKVNVDGEEEGSDGDGEDGEEDVEDEEDVDDVEEEEEDE